MSVKTKIQWCDSTNNSIMGCPGCELFPKPGPIFKKIDDCLSKRPDAAWPIGGAARLFDELLEEAWANVKQAVDTSSSGHVNARSTTNLYHLRFAMKDRVTERHGRAAGAAVKATIDAAVKCYAARLHLNRATSIVNPNRKRKVGYTKTFEQPTRFAGRIAEAARWPDLFQTDRAGKPWLNGLPRLIFLSDMGDFLGRRTDYAFLEREIEDTQSELGRRHLWLWLTKRPENMAEFASRIGGLPDNICAMTTVTSANTLSRVNSLRDVDCHIRALSVEPLWSPIADDLDLSSIDWVITGGESGAMATAHEFPVEWGTAIHERCREQGVAYFNKQLGRNPTRDGQPIRLKDSHGGDWNEWEPSLRVRQFPTYFASYRIS